MDFTTDQLKSLKEGFCREKIRSSLSMENRPKRMIVQKVDIERLDTVGQYSTSDSRRVVVNGNPRVYYLRITSEGATPITREKYLWEVNVAPSSWSYIWGIKRNVLEFCREHKLTIKGELI